MLVLRNKNYRYQEKDFGLGDWINGLFGSKYKTVDTGMVVNGNRPTPITPGITGPAPAPTATSSSQPVGTYGPQTRQQKKDFRRQQELDSITTADKQKIMKENRLKSAKKLDRALQQDGSWQQRQALQQVRARNQEGTTNLNVSKAAREKARLDLKTKEGVNVDAWSGLRDRANNKEYMAQRRMERAQRVGQINKGPAPNGMGSNTAKFSTPPPLISASSGTSQSNIPSFLTSPINSQSAINGLNSTNNLKPNPNNPNSNNPKPNNPNSNNPKPNNSKPNNPKPNNPKPNPQTTTPATSNAAKTNNFKMSTGGKIGTGAAALGAGYLLYNHFKNKDK